MFDREVDDASDLIFVDAALDCGDDGDVETDLSEAIESAQLLLQDVGLAADRVVGLPLEAVELEVEGGAHLLELREKPVVVRDALAVGVQHDEADVAGVS